MTEAKVAHRKTVGRGIIAPKDTVLETLQKHAPEYVQKALGIDGSKVHVYGDREGCVYYFQLPPEAYPILKEKLEPYGPGQLANTDIAHPAMRDGIKESKRYEIAERRFELLAAQRRSSSELPAQSMIGEQPPATISYVPEEKSHSAAARQLDKKDAKLRTIVHTLREALFDHGMDGWFHTSNPLAPSRLTKRELTSPLRVPYYERSLCFDNYSLLAAHPSLIKPALKILLEDLHIDVADAQVEFRRGMPPGPNIRIAEDAFEARIKSHLGKDAPGNMISNVEVLGGKRVEKDWQHGSMGR